jgi:hypothetical protein
MSAKAKAEMALTFTKAVARFAGSGCKLVERDVFDARAATCNDCEKWDGEALSGVGRCTECGCTGFKRFMATESCPIGKWKT